MPRANKSRPAVDADSAPEHDVAAELAANRRQQRRQELRQQSFPARCHQLLIGVKLCDEHLSAALATEIQKHAAEAAELSAMIDASITQLADAVADAEESDDYLAVLNGLDAVKIDRPVVMQTLVGLWKRAVVLAEERLEEFRANVEPAIAAADAELAAVRDELTHAGSGVEGMPAWPKNGHLAKRQFEFHVRTQNTRGKAAVAAAANAQHLVNAARRISSPASGGSRPPSSSCGRKSCGSCKTDPPAAYGPSSGAGSLVTGKTWRRTRPIDTP